MAPFLSTRRLQQPQGPVEIDWAHPLARGLVFFQVPTMPGAPDLVGGGKPTILSGSSLKAGVAGVGLSTTDGSTQGWGTPYRSDRFRTITDRIPRLPLHADIDTPVDYGKIISMQCHQTNWNDPWIAMALGRANV